ncbi:MAG: hypothetical protein AAGA66_13090 [Bacteroidota bacterium]
MIQVLMVFVTALMYFTGYSQGAIGIGTNEPEESAILEVKSETKGMLIPRMAGNSLIKTPAKGLIIYNTDQEAFNYYDGSDWIRLIPNTANFDLNMEVGGVNKKIVNLDDGINNNDAVNRGQLNTVDTNNLDRDGTDTMTGNLNMNDHRITRIENGVDASDAVNVSQAVLNEGNTGTFGTIRIKVIEIGVWNMVANNSVDLTTGITYSAIRGVTGIIYNDFPSFPARIVNEFNGGRSNTGTVSDNIKVEIRANGVIRLKRDDGSFYTNAQYDNTAINRGYMTVIYEGD